MQFPQLTEEEQAALYPTDEIEIEEELEPEEEIEETPAEPEEEAVKETPVEPVKAPEAPEDKNAAARYRYEAAEAKREAAALKAELEAVRAPKQDIPSREENYEGHIEARIDTTQQDLKEIKAWKASQEAERQEKEMYNGAISELQGYEASYATVAPDYKEAANHLKGMIATSIKLLEPAITPENLAKKTIDRYIGHAAKAFQEGINPAQALYSYAMESGYSKAETKSEEKPSNLSALAANKKKSSGMLAAKGSGGKPNLTKESASQMSTAEFSRLSPEEAEHLLYGS